MRVLDDKVRCLGDKISAPDDLSIGFHSEDYHVGISEPRDESIARLLREPS